MGNSSSIYTSGDYEFEAIRFRYGNSTGSGVYIGAAGRTVIGSGESSALYESDHSDETMFVTGDHKIYLVSGL